jgi:hypothetical protein
MPRFSLCGYYGWILDKGDKTDSGKKNALHYYELGCKHGMQTQVFNQFLSSLILTSF